MTHQLVPAPGFDWNAVSWGAPDQPRTEICCLCDAPFGEGEVPMFFASPEGWVAEFCESCALRWWRIERLA